MTRYAGLGDALLPTQGRLGENLRALARVTAVRRGWLRPTFPPTDDLDEFPLVPFLLGSRGEIVFDSSAMAEWLDQRGTASQPTLLPPGGAVRFAARVIDEYFDEVGLYLAHHNRWVHSAADNDAGERPALEFRALIPRSLRRRFASNFSRRQVRRLPYLFSVAGGEPDRYGVPPPRRPPRREGFPPTHDLLDELFLRTLDGVENVLRAQPFVLGDCFSIADASVYGQLAMNMSDPTVAAAIEIRAPATAAWVRALSAAPAPPATTSHELRSATSKLLRTIGEAFVPLMRQNEAAYEAARLRGERTFNEAAFERHRALYDGVLCGHPFRSVVKTFQVKVWRRLKAEWRALSPDERAAFPFACE